MSESAEDIQRYDVLIMSHSPGFNMVEQGTKAVMNYLVASGFMRPTDEAIAAEWVEVYGTPGPTAHEAFTRGAFAGGYEPYLELTVRTGQKFVDVPFGAAKGSETRFYLLFRGALWKELAPKFKNRLNKLLMTRCEVSVREHVGPVPPHREVGEDELPEDKKFARKERSTPRVGTAVEEF